MLKITSAAHGTATKLTFALPADQPEGPVSVVGNFNDWTPGATRLVKRSNGQRSASVTVPADYIANFRYLAEDGVWFDETEADFIDDGASVVWGREWPARREVIADAATTARTRTARSTAARKVRKVKDAVVDAVTG